MRRRTSSRKVRVIASRGLLLDRKGRVLAGNRPGFNLVILPSDAKEATIARLAKLLGEPEDMLLNRIKESKRWSPFVPAILKEYLSWDELSRVEEHIRELPGVDIEYQPIRRYPGGDMACHILGYIGEISPTEMGKPEYAGYQMGDYTGKSGLEKMFEKWLKGTDGYRLKIVDAQGRERPQDLIPGLKFEPRPPAPGKNVRLTLDLNLEQLAQDLLKDKGGSIVMLSVKDGEVLAMASAPTFNPEVFSGAIRADDWKKLETDPDRPLFNRSIQGAYPLGSVFKLVEALAALETKVIDPEQKLPCTGIWMFGNIAFHCWRKGGHGMIALTNAIIQSCDIYFYQIGNKLGVDRIAHYSNLLGLGLTTGIGLGGESGGLIPTAAWRENVKGEKWNAGDTISVAIGQGYVLVTPLQAATLAMIIANEGKLWRPMFLKEVEGVAPEEYQEFSPMLNQKTVFNERTWKIVKEAMAGVVSNPSGTGYFGARSTKVTIAGKTGTAQVIKLKEYQGMNEGAIPVRYRDHAWFVAFAPVENPKVAVSVLVEHGGHGASAAAPLARSMIEKYFELYSEENSAPPKP